MRLIVRSNQNAIMSRHTNGTYSVFDVPWNSQRLQESMEQKLCQLTPVCDQERPEPPLPVKQLAKTGSVPPLNPSGLGGFDPTGGEWDRRGNNTLNG